MNENYYPSQPICPSAYTPVGAPSIDPLTQAALKSQININEKRVSADIAVHKQAEIETVKTNAQIQRNALGIEIRSSQGELILFHERIGIPELPTKLLSAQPLASIILEATGAPQRVLCIKWFFPDHKIIEMNIPESQWDGGTLTRKMNAAGISLRSVRNRKLIYDRLLSYLIDHAQHVSIPCRYGWQNTLSGFSRVSASKELMEDYFDEFK